jgi:ribosome-interacting GTPase 1
MSTSTEERLARLEVLVPELRDDIKELKATIGELRSQVGELTKALHWGTGAGWALLKAGVVLVGLASVGKVVWDVVKH